ncbi:hypothetical protein, partial [Xenorhabdus budapestensis]|uniref:hypothetical protein n=1 Tax=Xenorhabdus budapestensis TaxID=290110 RepID=UPI001B80766A
MERLTFITRHNWQMGNGKWEMGNGSVCSLMNQHLTAVLSQRRRSPSFRSPSPFSAVYFLYEA